MNDDVFDEEKILKNQSKPVEFYSSKLKTKEKEKIDIENHYYIRTFKLFSQCNALNIEHPNVTHITTFLFLK